MHLEATGQPIRYRLKTGVELTLRPGVPMELPAQAATQLLKKPPAMVRRVEGIPSVLPSVAITWLGADGTERRGVVDFLHTDADGSVWAFCTRPDGGWCAVNTKYIHGYDGGTRRAES